VVAGLKIEKTKEGIKEILKEFRKIKSDLTLKELKKAKENIKGKLDLFLETSENRLQFYILQELLENRILTKKEIFKKIDQITLSDVKNFSKDFLKNQNLNLAIIHPYLEKKELEKILKI